jgi:hypothetical protein
MSDGGDFLSRNGWGPTLLPCEKTLSRNFCSFIDYHGPWSVCYVKIFNLVMVSLAIAENHLVIAGQLHSLHPLVQHSLRISASDSSTGSGRKSQQPSNHNAPFRSILIIVEDFHIILLAIGHIKNHTYSH